MMKTKILHAVLAAGMALVMTSCAGNSASSKPASAGATMTKEGEVVPEAMEFKGNVAKVDAERMLLTVQRLPLSRTFSVPADCRIMTPTNDTAVLTELKVDDPVVVRYDEVDGKWVANRIVHSGMGAKRENEEKLQRLDEMLNPNPNP